MKNTITIKGKSYILTDEVRQNPEIRRSFDALAQNVFGLSFEDWYHNGYWQDAYVPHVVMDEQTVVANVSVNRHTMRREGQERPYIQLGTVMTHPAYRNRGFQAFLLDFVLKKWAGTCECVLLFANENVLEFYPRFGFVKAQEYRCEMQLRPRMPSVKKLDMAQERDVLLLLEYYGRGNRFSALSSVGNEGLLMFYCLQSLRDCVYYCEAQDAVVIAEQEGGRLLCYDVFGGDGFSLEEILLAAAPAGTREVVFGFMPQDTNGLLVKPVKDKDTTLFVLDNQDCVFKKQKLLFPLLAHA